MPFTLVRHLLACCLAAGVGVAMAGEVSVAVAANFAAPMAEIARGFERATGHRARVALGSTGKFFAQIVQGAPFQVLLAADEATPARLEAQGHGVPGSRAVYAVGQLVLWSRTPGLADGGADVLRGAGFRRLALADPRLAPYGQAAWQVLDSLGLSDRLAPTLVRGDSVAQAFHFVASGNAELGFVAASQLAARPGQAAAGGSAWPVPDGLHAPIRQAALLLRKGVDEPAALALMQYLAGEPARTIILAHGYRLP